NGKVVPTCPRNPRLLDPGCRVAGEQLLPHRRLPIAMAPMRKSEPKVSELCQEFVISRQTLYRHASANGEACPDGVRVLSRRWRRTRLRTFENQGCETGDVSVRRPCPGERCGRDAPMDVKAG